MSDNSRKKDTEHTVDADLERCFREMVEQVHTPQARALMYDAIWALEERSRRRRVSANIRDVALEGKLREVIAELSRAGSHGTDLAVDLVDALVHIDYTERAAKLPRLCRTLFSVMRNSNEKTAQKAAQAFSKVLTMVDLIKNEEVNCAKVTKEAVVSELNELCDQLQSQLHARTQARNTTTHGVMFMVCCRTVAQHQPKYLTQLRGKVLALTIASCGVSEVSLRNCAFDCLCALLVQPATTVMKTHEVQAELTRMVDEAMRHLRSGNTSEPMQLSAINSIRAILAAKGTAAIDRTKLNNICVAVVSLHKVSKVQTVRLAICELIPHLTRADPAARARMQPYSQAIIEPIKNVRDLSAKNQELRNLASFISAVGYDSLDSPDRINVENIVPTLLNRHSQIQAECWKVIATMCATTARLLPSLTKLVIEKCLPTVQKCTLTSSLLESLEMLKKCAGLTDAVEDALRQLVDRILITAERGDDHPQPSPAQTPRARGQSGFFGFFRGEGSGTQTGSGEGNTPTGSKVHPADEVICALSALDRRELRSVRETTENLGGNLSNLLRHPSSEIRQACSSVYVNTLVRAVPFAREPHGFVPQEEKNALVEVMVIYLKNSLLEPESQVRYRQIEILDVPELYGVLVDSLRHLFFFLQDRYRIRELVLKILVGILQRADVKAITDEITSIVQGCIATLEYSTDPKMITKQVGDLMSFTIVGIRVFDNVLTRLLRLVNDKILDPNVGESPQVPLLRLAGNLASMIEREKQPVENYLSDFTDLINTMLQVVRNKQEEAQVAALDTLLQLLSVTPNVTISHADRLWLNETMASLYISTNNNQHRLLFSKLFGYFGAVFPKAQTRLTSEAESLGQETALEHVDVNPTDFAVTVYHAIIRVLSEASSDNIVMVALQTLLQLVKGSEASLVHGRTAMRCLMRLVTEAEQVETKTDYLHIFSALVSFRVEQATSLLSEIVVALQPCWQTQEPRLFEAVLDLVEKLDPGTLSESQIEEEWPWLFPRLMDAAMADTLPGSPVASKVVSILESCVNLPMGTLQHVVPCLTAFIGQSDRPNSLRCGAAATVVAVISERKAERYLPGLLHSLRKISRHILTDPALAAQFSNTLQHSLQRLHQDFSMARATVRNILAECSVQTSVADRVLSVPKFERENRSISRMRIMDSFNNNNQSDEPPGIHGIIAHIDTALHTRTVQWKKWFTEFRRLLFVSSPQYAFRISIHLYDKNEKLRRELFNPSFFAFVRVLDHDELKANLRSALAKALESGEGEVVGALLGAADYMQQCDAIRLYEGVAETPKAAPTNNEEGTDGDASPMQRKKNYESFSNFFSSPGVGVAAGSINSLDEIMASQQQQQRQLAAAASQPQQQSNAAANDSGWTPKRVRALRDHKYDVASLTSLCRAAIAAKMHVKAVRYLESMLNEDVGADESEKGKRMMQLGELYHSLGLQASIQGLFASSDAECNQQKGKVYELQQKWRNAATYYHTSIKNGDNEIDALQGLIRTHTLCGDWVSALQAAKGYLGQQTAANHVTNEIAHSASIASWMLGNWDDMKSAARLLEDAGPTYVFTSVLVFREGTDAQLLDVIKSGRKRVEVNLRAMLPLGYHHAAQGVTTLEHLRDIEEAFAYRSGTPSFQREMREAWYNRFCSTKGEALSKVISLSIFKLVAPPTEMVGTWLYFCRIMRYSNSRLTAWAMDELQKSNVVWTIPSADAQLMRDDWRLRIGHCHFLWDRDERQLALTELDGVVNSITGSVNMQSTRDKQIFGEALVDVALWTQTIVSAAGGHFWSNPCRDEILRHLHMAVDVLPDDYQVWHHWALMNYRVQQRDRTINKADRESYITKAHQGFVAAVCKSSSADQALQDVLRLMQLWIHFDGIKYLSQAVVCDAILRIPVSYWVQVVPQFIAHLADDDIAVQTVVATALRTVCSAHPDAAAFPLLVPVLTDEQQTAAQLLRATHARSILEQSLPREQLANTRRVAEDLIHVAALPIENLREMLGNVLRPLQDSDKETMPELVPLVERMAQFVDFHATTFEAVGKVNIHLGTLINQMVTSRERAVSFCRRLYNELESHVNHISTVRLVKHAPRLLNVKDLRICVPGEYAIGADSPRILYFHDGLTIIPSKHRPRKLILTGTDGKMYSFCLKGNEDCRIDERVMQLFGMVNALMLRNSDDGITITRFHVTPLSSKVGMLGWVENTETMHQVVAHCRKRTKQPLDAENAMLEDHIGTREFAKLSTLQKVEIFECIRNQTHSSDIAHMMWQRSRSAEQWLTRRSTYTQSLALMSMVGYVLGLGDRHMGNLLMNVQSGQIVHIDFGDCFDVARLRTAYPETVPFRLTPMLIKPMEVFGVGGEFSSTALQSMTVLRQSRDSLIALLSAFIYDPIVNTRVLEKIGSPAEVVERMRCKLEGVHYTSTFEPPRRDGIPLPLRPDIHFFRSTCDPRVYNGQREITPVEDQINHLIAEATSLENQTEIFQGWCPMW